MHYDYRKARAYCDAHGLVFHEDALPVADARFASLELLQYQVDGLMELYCWNMNYYWRPSIYAVRQRIAIAIRFLFGR